MANKVIDSDLQVNGSVKCENELVFTNIGSSEVSFSPNGEFVSGISFSGSIMLGLSDNRNRKQLTLLISHENISSWTNNNKCEQELGRAAYPWIAVYAKKFIVPNGTASQFLKADGSLDENSYALHTDLNAVKTNAWKLDEANAEVSTVVVTLQGDMSVFAAMDKAGINYQTSRNIYVDMSEADFTLNNIFAGFENLPIGVRYHIFFGNTKHDCKINWDSSKVESNKLSGNLALTAEYPTAKCEFMRVTDSWTYADWEALIDEVSHVIDTGTASESDNATLMDYMTNNKVSYTKTTNGALVNITALLAALTGNGK